MFNSPHDASVPKLPKTAIYMPGSGPCEFLQQDFDDGGANPSVPTNQTMPSQHGTTTPASDYFPTTAKERATPAEHRTDIEVPEPRPATLKSSYNKLAQTR